MFLRKFTPNVSTGEGSHAIMSRPPVGDENAEPQRKPCVGRVETETA